MECNVYFAKMADIIKHRGIVEKVTDSHVIVRIVQTSACSACSAKGLCNASESKEKLIDVYEMNASYQIGGVYFVWFYINGNACSVSIFWHTTSYFVTCAFYCYADNRRKCSIVGYFSFDSHYPILWDYLFVQKQIK